MLRSAAQQAACLRGTQGEGDHAVAVTQILRAAQGPARRLRCRAFAPNEARRAGLARAVRTHAPLEDYVNHRSNPLHILAVCTLLSCAHGAAAPGAKPASSTPAPPQPRAASRLPAQGPERTDPTALELYMPEHFQIVTWARDALINGELELAREPLEALAAYEYEDIVPGAWIDGIGRVQLLAGVAAKAQTTAQAASGIAAIANECGQCHRATIEQPTYDSIEPLQPQLAGESFRQRMRRHGWALDRMWEGLVLPSENAWARGASALADGPYEAPGTDPPLRPEARNALEALRALGAKAADTEGWPARGQLYAELLVGCSSCHQGVY
jgi:hypothetical protein